MGCAVLDRITLHMSAEPLGERQQLEPGGTERGSGNGSRGTADRDYRPALLALIGTVITGGGRSWRAAECGE